MGQLAALVLFLAAAFPALIYAIYLERCPLHPLSSPSSRVRQSRQAESPTLSPEERAYMAKFRRAPFGYGDHRMGFVPFQASPSDRALPWASSRGGADLRKEARHDSAKEAFARKQLSCSVYGEINPDWHWANRNYVLERCDDDESDES